MRRAIPFAVVFSAFVVFPGSLLAEDASLRHLATVTVRSKDANRNHETYRGYYSDLSAIADRKDLSELTDGLRHQIDIVESAGLSLRVLQFLRSMPIVIDDFACLGDPTATSSDAKPITAAACYSRQVPESMREKHLGASVWDSENGWLLDMDPLTRAELTHTGVVMFRPITLTGQDRERPALLHELLHAFHDHILPGGFANPAALSWFKQASDKQLYPADQYLMTNEREFFAVTASVFLSGKDGALVRATIKEKQPDYYRYLVWLFECDPDRTSRVPVASAN